MKVCIVIAPHFSAEQMQQAYLTAISWLNFEHELSLLWLEESGRLIEQLPHKKQWQSLWLYGLQNSHYLGDQKMPIRSQKISAETLVQQLQTVDLLL